MGPVVAPGRYARAHGCQLDPESPLPVGEVSRLIGGWIDRLGAVWVEGPDHPVVAASGEDRMRSFHSATGRPYFFSMDGKYEAGPFTAAVMSMRSLCKRYKVRVGDALCGPPPAPEVIADRL
ncbi:hypothetical protein SVIOM342S_01017 [Streptomyces violaceorubidus]